MISLEEVSFAYAGMNTDVLHRVSAEIPSHRIVGLVGPNGAGKTTLFDLLMGTLRPKHGKIKVGDSESDKIILVQNLNLPHRSKIEELGRGILSLNGVDPDSGMGGFLGEMTEIEKSRFDRLRSKTFGQCSVGERRWFVAALTLFFPKKIVLLDEPTAGVDPEYRHLIWERVKRAKNEGKCILVSSHMLDEMDKHVDEFYFISNRRLRRFDSIGEFVREFQAKDSDEAFVKATVAV